MRSGIGKSTICLGLLGALIRKGIDARDLAYIKPVTQCVDKQNVAIFCENNGISCCPIGPVIFETGFTQAFISGMKGPSASILEGAVTEVKNIGVKKKFVLIDGVGYPSVGSVAGIPSEAIIKSVNATTLIVAEGGVGNAVDSINFIEGYYKSKGINPKHAIINNVDAHEAKDIASSITKYFSHTSSSIGVLGFVPPIKTNIGESFEEYINIFSNEVDFELLM